MSDKMQEFIFENLLRAEWERKRKMASLWLSTWLYIYSVHDSHIVCLHFV